MNSRFMAVGSAGIRESSVGGTSSASVISLMPSAGTGAVKEEAESSGRFCTSCCGAADVQPADSVSAAASRRAGSVFRLFCMGFHLRNAAMRRVFSIFLIIIAFLRRSVKNPLASQAEMEYNTAV